MLLQLGLCPYENSCACCRGMNLAASRSFSVEFEDIAERYCKITMLNLLLCVRRQVSASTVTARRSVRPAINRMKWSLSRMRTTDSCHMDDASTSSTPTLVVTLTSSVTWRRCVLGDAPVICKSTR